MFPQESNFLLSLAILLLRVSTLYGFCHVSDTFQVAHRFLKPLKTLLIDKYVFKTLKSPGISFCPWKPFNFFSNIANRWIMWPVFSACQPGNHRQNWQFAVVVGLTHRHGRFGNLASASGCSCTPTTGSTSFLCPYGWCLSRYALSSFVTSLLMARQARRYTALITLIVQWPVGVTGTIVIDKRTCSMRHGCTCSLWCLCQIKAHCFQI